MSKFDSIWRGSKKKRRSKPPLFSKHRKNSKDVLEPQSGVVGVVAVHFLLKLVPTLTRTILEILPVLVNPFFGRFIPLFDVVAGFIHGIACVFGAGLPPLLEVVHTLIRFGI